MKRYAGPILAVVVLIVAAVVIHQIWTRAGSGGAALQLSEVRGEVTVLAPGADPVDAAVGLELGPDDRVRTGPDGTAVLAVGDDTRIVVDAGSAVQITEVSARGVSMALEDGLVEFEVRPGSGALNINSGDRGFAATDASGRVAYRDGTLAAEVSRGEVEVTGADGVDALAAGERMVAADGEAASVMAIPDDVLLDVAWPEEHVTRAALVYVSGTTSPGATVRVASGVSTVEAVADADGAFEVEVPLDEGSNNVSVTAVDPFGQEARVSDVFERDTTGPSAVISVEQIP